MNTIFEYEKNIQNAITQGLALLDKISKLSSNDDLDPVNYDNIILKIEQTIAELQTHIVRYKYDKMDRTEFNLILKNIADGKKINLITIGIPYKIRSIDTIQFICKIYDISIEDLLSYNRITAEEFDDLKERNEFIKIPKVMDLNDRVRFANIPVFGSLSESNAWGKDWPNKLEVNDKGNIRILSNAETIAQGINNWFGEWGNIPGYEEETIDLDWGSDYDTDIIDLMTIAKVQNKIMKEPRIDEVKDISIKSVDSGKELTITVTPVNKVDTIEVLIENKSNILQT